VELTVGAAKVSKWAVRESGDTLEVIERPHGGLSLVLADGQGSGQAFLFHYRHGKVSATLNIVSADLQSRTLVVSRNNPCPAILVSDGEVQVLDERSTAIGMHRRMKPIVVERPIAPGTCLVAFTDGLETAGHRYGQPFDILAEIRRLVAGDAPPSALRLAEGLLTAAVARDQGRPNDDMSVVALTVLPHDRQDLTRRMWISFPVG
jgi:serine phosphatase RsbU (regulator of sigma subunit)